MSGHPDKYRSSIVLVVLALCICGCDSGDFVPKSAALIVQAKEAVEQGDKEAALAALGKSIDAEPSSWAFAMRARLYAEAGEDEKADSDVQAGLKLDNENAELKWIQKELKRPVEKRFQSNELPTSK
jgi:Tfp pilus assembly protein PilF